MEGQAERFVHLFTALAAVEQVRLNVIKNGEEHTARLVGRNITIGAGNALSDGGYDLDQGTILGEMERRTHRWQRWRERLSREER